MDIIKSMREFQKKYFPKDVGKKCPCCNKKIEGTKVNSGWVRSDVQDATTKC